MPPLPPRFNIGGTRGQRTKLTGAIFLTDDHAPLGPSLHNVNSRGRGVQGSIDETSHPSTMLKVVQYFFHPQYWWRPCVRLLSPRFENRVFCPQSLSYFQDSRFFLPSMDSKFSSKRGPGCPKTERGCSNLCHPFHTTYSSHSAATQ